MKIILNFLKKLFGIKPKVQPKKYNFGWIKDKPDPRDKKFKIVVPHDLPKSVDLRDLMPPIYDQGELGSCTSNSIAAAYQYEMRKQNKQDFIPSRLFIYYNEREMEGTINEDAGAEIRNGIKSLTRENYGVCPETMWPYIIKKFKDKPTEDCYRVALDNQIIEYLRITPHNLYDIKHCLSEGYPVIYGFLVFSSFMSPNVTETGIAPIPKPGEESEGGHAVLCVGYNDDTQRLIVRNSWGISWGQRGYFEMPYYYITEPNLSSDFWSIRLVE